MNCSNSVVRRVLRYLTNLVPLEMFYQCFDLRFCLDPGVQDVTLIDQDGSPHGPQRYVLWNPPLTHFNEALKAANPDSSIGQMSRTEGRARKGERK